jgi:hypothetical protein
MTAQKTYQRLSGGAEATRRQTTDWRARADWASKWGRESAIGKARSILELQERLRQTVSVLQLADGSGSPISLDDRNRIALLEQILELVEVALDRFVGSAV